jgi:hypothetical protein
VMELLLIPEIDRDIKHLTGSGKKPKYLLLDMNNREQLLKEVCMINNHKMDSYFLEDISSFRGLQTFFSEGTLKGGHKVI